ncbi:hypothetical protein B0H15DRAFT_844769 [Mycena belliarum]|uniref:Golgi apparatus membrane protein TVP38 n=1 Tax=Mycena belliarum TaxID=1033014 RepID=A0AAD6U4E9_9AGAR|nr:hypothetical protein B0H15DRAFT_844769 [Mycena belliae]
MAMPYPAYRPSHSDSTLAMGSYPPPNGSFDPSSVSTFNSHAKGTQDIRNISRTPSPTPSEAKALSDGLFNWKQLLSWRFWLRKEWITYYIIIFVLVAVTALVTLYHTQIVKALLPATHWLHDFKFGWLVPIGIFFIISFPPLFGHEIVAILCGLVWGLWVGFGIVAAGTFLGEVGNFYAFKYCCRARGEKMERTQIPYACLAHCVRTGGFKIALVARFSAIPGHFTTAVFSTCGMGIVVFSIAAILSLPKQFITVYLGVIIEQANEGKTDTKTRIISNSVLAVTALVTILAMWWILRQMAHAKPDVIYARRKARQAKQTRADIYVHPQLNDSDASVGGAFNPRGSLSDIPLTASGAGLHPRYDYEQQQKQRQHAEWAAQQRQYHEQAEQHQQWDAQGRAVGYTPGPAPQVMYAPQPQRSGAGAGRAEIVPGAYVPPGDAEVHAHGRRQQTSDEVGWDTQMRERPQEYASRRQSLPFQPAQAQSPPQTPTQAQYAAYQPRAADALPTPPFPRSPFADPGHLHHGVEPTGASYHTAYDDDGAGDAGTGRTFSPPPPSYRTDVVR